MNEDHGTDFLKKVVEMISSITEQAVALQMLYYDYNQMGSFELIVKSEGVYFRFTYDGRDSVLSVYTAVHTMPNGNEGWQQQVNSSDTGITNRDSLPKIKEIIQSVDSFKK